MKMNFAKLQKSTIQRKIITIILTCSLVFSSFIPAFADDSTTNFNYYQIGSSLNRYMQSGTNSADMVGRLLDISSYNQTMIYNRLLQFPITGSDLTTVNSYISSIDSKLGTIRDSLGIGSSLDNVLQNQTSNLQHLSDVLSKLSYWDNNHARSYDLSEMIFSIMYDDNNIADTIEKVLSGGAITSDWHWNDNGTWRAVGNGAIPVLNRNSDGQLYLNVYPYENANLSIKGLVQAIIRNQFYTATAIRGTYENNSFIDYTSSGAITNEVVDNVIKGLSKINNNLSYAFLDNNNLLKKINDDYNNIDWIDSGSYLGTTDTFNGNTYVNQGTQAKSLYGVMNANIPSSIAYMRLPITNRTLSNLASDIDIKFYYLTGSNKRIDIPVQVIAYEFTRTYSDLIVDLSSVQIENVELRVEFTSKSSNVYCYSANNTFIKSVDMNTKDFYDVQGYAYNFNINKLFEQAKFMFFDDESIAAKKANASQTSTVINNYTGSGKASASASDYADIANSVDSVSAGLNTGVSISNIFNIYNNTDGYSFWSAETRNELNTTNSNRLMKSSNSSDTPLYDAKLNELFSYMGVDKK